MLIVTEGKVTEPRYLEDLKRELRLHSLRVEVCGRGGVPKTVVEHAAEKLKEAKREARREGDALLAYSEVWCAFDKDDHALDDTLAQARDNGISVALSNPCFELWALIHFQDQFASITRQELRRVLLRHLPGYQKELPADQMRTLRQRALTRARLMEEHRRAAGDIFGCPSAGIHRLISWLLDQVDGG